MWCKTRRRTSRTRSLHSRANAWQAGSRRPAGAGSLVREREGWEMAHAPVGPVEQEAPSPLKAFVGAAATLRRESWGNPWGYVFIAPAIILYLVFNFWVLIR